MKTELLRSYSSSNLTSLSRTSSKISLALESSSSSFNLHQQQQRAGAGAGTIESHSSSRNGKSDVNLNVTLDTDPKNEETCLQKIFSEKGLKKAFPIFRWLPKYSLGKFSVDVVAGITIALTVLPQGLAYASLGGLPPQYGLYSSFVGCFIYIFIGSTKAVTIGPTAVLSILTLYYSSGKPPEYAVLLALLTGITTLCMGIFRLGFIVNFISTPVNSAFTSAAAITICSTQVKALLGLSYPAEDFLSIIEGVFEHFPDVKMNDTLLSVACITALLFLQNLPKMMSKVLKNQRVAQKVVWLISVARNAIVIVICTAIFTCMGSNDTPVKVVGNLTSGLPPFQFPPVSFTDPRTNSTYSFGKLLKEDTSAILVMPLLAIMEHITIAKAFAGSSRVDASQEMVSIGIANIFGTFFSSMSVTGSFSRTTVNHASGVQTPMGGLITGIMVLLSLQFLTPYFYFIPKASLGAVIVCAVLNMVEFSILYPMWKTKKMDLLPWTVTFVMSLLVGLEFGILTGLLISIVFLLYYAARPCVRVMKGETLSGAQFIMVSSDRSLVFPAIEYTRYIVMKSGRTWGNGNLAVVIDCQHIQYADFTAALGIRDLFKLFNEKGQTLILWKMKPSIVRILTQVMDLDKEPFKHCSNESELEKYLVPASEQQESRIDMSVKNKRDGKIKFDLQNRQNNIPSTLSPLEENSAKSTSSAKIQTFDLHEGANRRKTRK